MKKPLTISRIAFPGLMFQYKPSKMLKLVGIRLPGQCCIFSANDNVSDNCVIIFFRYVGIGMLTSAVAWRRKAVLAVFESPQIYSFTRLMDDRK